MTNYQNDIIELLEGDTPKQKYEFLQRLLKPNIVKMQWIETKQDTPVIDTDVIIACKNGENFNYMIAFMDGDEDWFDAGAEDELGLIPDYWAYIQKP